MKFFDFSMRPPEDVALRDSKMGDVFHCNHENRDHVIIHRECIGNRISRSPTYSEIVWSLWVCCVWCGNNYQGGYCCELVHFDGSACGTPFVDCPLHPDGFDCPIEFISVNVGDNEEDGFDDF